MRVVITGGTGRLGAHLVRQASAAGHQVSVLSHSSRLDGVEVRRADLASGDGLLAVIADADAVLHAASDPRRAQAVDVDGTARLLEAATRAGVKRIVYVSIIGVDQIPYPYYAQKYRAEQLIQSSGLRYSIVRAAQFHSFVDAILRALSRVPLVVPLPAAFAFQSVAEEEVAARVVNSLVDPPNQRIDFAGPEVLAMDAMAREWLDARGLRKRVARLWLPGKTARAFRQRKNTSPSAERGAQRWSDWLRLGVSYSVPRKTDFSSTKQSGFPDGSVT